MHFDYVRVVMWTAALTIGCLGATTLIRWKGTDWKSPITLLFGALTLFLLCGFAPIFLHELGIDAPKFLLPRWIGPVLVTAFWCIYSVAILAILIASVPAEARPPNEDLPASTWRLRAASLPTLCFGLIGLGLVPLVIGIAANPP